jgi:class 3 adenylate cyclase
MEPVRGYARSGDTSIAYAVIGDGPLDLLFFLPFGNPIELGWEIPLMARFWERLASFTRLVMFDQRGTGASDATAAPPTLEEHVADARAVADAVGFEQFVVAGGSQSSPQTILFAHRHHDRVRRLVLYAATARLLEAPEYPIGLPRPLVESFTERYASGWGTGATLDLIAPSEAGDPQLRQWWGRAERTAGNPGMVRRVLGSLVDADVRAEAAELTMPTLITHRRGDSNIPATHGRWLAQAISGSTHVEFEGRDHMTYFGDARLVLDTIEEWLMGTLAAGERVLTTLLFTDIVGSTARATELGDREWRRLLERHDAATRHEIVRAGGTELTFAGDGFVAEFPTASAAVRAARAIRDAVRALGLDVRAGIHTTECERIGVNVGGLGVHVAARVAAAARGGEILVSRTVADVLVGAGLELDDRGEHDLKGVPGRWRLLALSD